MRIPLLFLLFFSFYQLSAQTEAIADNLSQAGQDSLAFKSYQSLRTQDTHPNTQLRLAWKIAKNGIWSQKKEEGNSNLYIEQFLIRELEKHEANAADSVLAKVYHQLGNKQYRQNFKEKKAIQSWEKAIRLQQQFLKEKHLDIARAYRNIGNAYSYLNNFNQAEKAFQNALSLQLSHSQKDKKLLANTYMELGYVLSKQGDFAAAKYHLESALEFCKTVYADQPYKIGYNYNLLVLLYQQQRKPTEMIKYGKKSLDFYQQDSGQEERIANAYNNLAIAHEWNLEYDTALFFYKKSIHLNQKLPNRKAALAENYNNRAGVFLLLKKYKKAITDVDKAIAINEVAEDEVSLAANFNTKAAIFLKQKQYALALDFHQKSLRYLVPDFQPKNILDNPSPNDVVIGSKIQLIRPLFDKAVALNEYAQATRSIEHGEASLATFDTISVLIDRVRTSYESDESKSFLAHEAKGIFEQAIKVCFHLATATGEAELYYQKAYEYAERSKSVILLEAVKEAHAKDIANISPEYLEREIALKTTIAQAEQQLLTAEVDSEIQTARNNLLHHQTQLEQLIDTFENKFPAYYQLKYQFDLPSISDIQQGLLSEQMMVEYFVGKEHLYWFYIDQTQFKTGQIALDFSLKEWVIQFRNSIKSDDRIRVETMKNYAELGHQLFEKLLAAPLSHAQDQNRLRIIPDDILGYLPFDALLMHSLKETNLGRFVRYPFLQKKYALSYSFSTALLQEMNRLKRYKNKAEILAFAPSFSAPLPPLQLADTEIKLSAVEATIESTQSILSSFKGKMYLKEAANKATFLKKSEDYAFLHLATHGQMNDENADYSFISFAQTEDSIKVDELLFVNELYNMSLSSDIVVLSACETALGKLQAGEGIISMARAFAYAGAKSILTTLWKVSDDQTGKLMTAFYEQLGQGKSKDVALWAAKNSLIENADAHPYYWASFVPIGNMYSVQLDRRTSWFWYIAGSICLLLVAFLWWFFSFRFSHFGLTAKRSDI